MKTLTLLFVLTIISIASYAQQPCLKLTDIEMEKPLRLSDSVEVKLKFEPDATEKDCYVVTESQLKGTQAPTLDLEQTPEGITARIKTVKVQRMDHNVVANSKAREISITISLAAAAPAVTRDFTLSGTLHYNTVDSAGTIQPDSLAFSTPFRVAPSKPQVENHPFAKGLKRTGEVAAGIVLFPIFLLVVLIYCPISGQCPDC